MLFRPLTWELLAVSEMWRPYRSIVHVNPPNRLRYTSYAESIEQIDFFNAILRCLAYRHHCLIS